jgi:hypothetical protein
VAQHQEGLFARGCVTVRKKHRSESVKETDEIKLGLENVDYRKTLKMAAARLKALHQRATPILSPDDF